jgi:hypothetical protein
VTGGFVSVFGILALAEATAAAGPRVLRLDPPTDRACLVERTTARTKTVGGGPAEDETRARSRIEYNADGTGRRRRTSGSWTRRP